MLALTWSPKAILRTLGGRREKTKQSNLREDGTSGKLDLRAGVQEVGSDTQGGAGEGREPGG